ncbi:MAG TPA: hypothetical protein VHG10_06505 [Glycomyces sp.]|nr:hypothetical protein [Glycomyces sp.]
MRISLCPWSVGSPDGPGRTVEVDTGTPRFGVPSAFHEIFWTRVVRVVPQPSVAELLAW